MQLAAAASSFILVQHLTRMTCCCLPCHSDIYREHRNDMNDEKLRQMILAMEDVKAVLVTLAGRVHDMKSIHSLPVLKRQQLAQETLDIFSVVANRLGCWCLKAELEDLAFQTLHPEAYEDVKAQVSGVVTADGSLTATSTLPPCLCLWRLWSHLTACTVQMMQPVAAGQVPPRNCCGSPITHHPGCCPPAGPLPPRPRCARGNHPGHQGWTGRAGHQVC